MERKDGESATEWYRRLVDAKAAISVHFREAKRLASIEVAEKEMERRRLRDERLALHEKISSETRATEALEEEQSESKPA